MTIPILTLRESLDYNPQTGLFFWLERPVYHFKNDMRWSAAQAQKRWNTKFSGRAAFTTASLGGYLTGVVDSQRLLAHRAAWAISTGAWPTETIDHINGNRSDNRLPNLRHASRAEQSRNCAPSKSGTSIYLGVSYRSERRNWRAVIKANGRQLYLGSHATEKEAAKAYDQAAAKWHGQFARLNFPTEP